MFLLQQLPLVGVQLVQLRITAAAEIPVCTPKYQGRSCNGPHGLSPAADLLTFRALSKRAQLVLSWPALRGKD